MDAYEERASKRYAHFLDSRYFKDCEGNPLPFRSLDKELDGWLIKRRKLPALNTILPKFKEKVQLILHQIPFNRSRNRATTTDQIQGCCLDLLFGKTGCSWLCLNQGAIFVRCDYNGNMCAPFAGSDIWARML